MWSASCETSEPPCSSVRAGTQFCFGGSLVRSGLRDLVFHGYLKVQLIMERSFLTFSWSWIVCVMIQGFALENGSTCDVCMCFCLVEVAWPLWHRRFCLSAYNQAGQGCAGVRVWGRSSWRCRDGSPGAFPFAAGPLALSPRLWCRAARGTSQWAIIGHGWRLRIDIFTVLCSTFVASLPRSLPAPWPRAAAGVGKGRRQALCATGKRVKK